MFALRSLGIRRRMVWWVAAVLVMAVVGAGCGDDGPEPSPAPTPGPTPTQTQAPAARPDFVISSVSVSPAGPLVSPGQVTIAATVRNVGTADYTAGFIVVQAPGNHTGGFNGLAAGASDVATINFPVVSANTTYTFTLVVDPDNIIAEESETNNESSTIVINTGP